MPLIPKHVSHIQYARKGKIKIRKSYAVDLATSVQQEGGGAGKS